MQGHHRAKRCEVLSQLCGLLHGAGTVREMTRPIDTCQQGDDEDGALLVLASGGIDSSTLLRMCSDWGLRPSALFVDYGQPAASAERAAVKRICAHLDVPLSTIRHQGMPVGVGEIRGRNAFLLHTALLDFPASSGVIAIGIHGGTGYIDCSPQFLETMQRSYDLHTNGAITIAAPFLHWAKGDICAVAQHLHLPIAHTYSCEGGNSPCGLCRSCRDRELLVCGPVTC